MTSTTSSIRRNKELKETYLWSLKKHKGISALLALLMFMALPMILMIILSNQSNELPYRVTAGEWVNRYVQYISGVTTFLVTPLLLIFIILFSALLFGYMHQKRSVDLFHSLPVRRTPMMLGRLLAGFTLITAPVLLNFAITFIVGACYSVDISACFGNVISYMLWIILISTASLIFMILMAVCTGTTFDMMISALGVNLGYPLLIFLGNYLISSILPGYGNQVNIDSLFLTALSPFAAAFMPLMRISEFQAEFINPSFYIWWVIFSLILLAVTIILYNKRKSECAETGFAFPIPKLVIRFLITAVAGLGIGLILGETDEPINFFIGLFSGSLAAHIVVEAVYSRGFKNLKKSFIYYGLFLAVFFVTYTVFATGCFGYDTRVPQAEEVESISIESPYLKNTNIYNEHNVPVGKVIPSVKQIENIENIINKHKKAVSKKRSLMYPYCFDRELSNRDFSIVYHLKNGKTLRRNYPFSYNNTNYYDELLKEIIKIEEYRLNEDLIFYIDAQDIENIIIWINDEQKTFSPDLNVKNELLDCLKQDILDCKTESLISDDKMPKFNITINFKEQDYNKYSELKPFIKNYKGKIKIDENFYKIYSNSSKTAELIKELGWDK